MPEFPRSRWCSQIRHNYLGNYAKEERKEAWGWRGLWQRWTGCVVRGCGWEWQAIDTLKWECQRECSYEGQCAPSPARNICSNTNKQLWTFSSQDILICNIAHIVMFETITLWCRSLSACASPLPLLQLGEKKIKKRAKETIQRRE